MRSASLGPYALLWTSTSTYDMSFINNMLAHHVETEANLASAGATLDDTMGTFLSLFKHVYAVRAHYPP